MPLMKTLRFLCSSETEVKTLDQSFKLLFLKTLNLAILFCIYSERDFSCFNL